MKKGSSPAEINSECEAKMRRTYPQGHFLVGLLSRLIHFAVRVVRPVLNSSGAVLSEVLDIADLV